jgi:hypothetical protein
MWRFMDFVGYAWMLAAAAIIVASYATISRVGENHTSRTEVAFSLS